MKQKELNEILRKHRKWLYGGFGRKRADLRNEDLSELNLSSTDLSYADLSYADLSCADLSDDNLSDTNLSGANLSDADLGFANLSNANLSGAILNGTDLRNTYTQCTKGQKVISVQVDTSRRNNLISYWVDLGVWTTGCFQGSLEELKESIEQTHKYNKFLKDRYYRVIDFILQEAKYDEV